MQPSHLYFLISKHSLIETLLTLHYNPQRHDSELEVHQKVVWKKSDSNTHSTLFPFPQYELSQRGCVQEKESYICYIGHRSEERNAFEIGFVDVFEISRSPREKNVVSPRVAELIDDDRPDLSFYKEFNILVFWLLLVSVCLTCLLVRMIRHGMTEHDLQASEEENHLHGVNKQVVLSYCKFANLLQLFFLSFPFLSSYLLFTSQSMMCTQVQVYIWISHNNLRNWNSSYRHWAQTTTDWSILTERCRGPQPPILRRRIRSKRRRWQRIGDQRIQYAPHNSHCSEYVEHRLFFPSRLIRVIR